MHCTAALTNLIRNKDTKHFSISYISQMAQNFNVCLLTDKNFITPTHQQMYTIYTK